MDGPPNSITSSVPTIVTSGMRSSLPPPPRPLFNSGNGSCFCWSYKFYFVSTYYFTIGHFLPIRQLWVGRLQSRGSKHHQYLQANLSPPRQPPETQPDRPHNGRHGPAPERYYSHWMNCVSLIDLSKACKLFPMIGVSWSWLFWESHSLSVVCSVLRIVLSMFVLQQKGFPTTAWGLLWNLIQGRDQLYPTMEAFLPRNPGLTSKIKTCIV